MDEINENKEIAENQEENQNNGDNIEKLSEENNKEEKMKKEGENKVVNNNENKGENEEKEIKEENEGKEIKEENEEKEIKEENENKVVNTNENNEYNEGKEIKEENEGKVIKENEGKEIKEENEGKVIKEDEEKVIKEEKEKSETNKKEKISEIYQMERLNDFETYHDYIFRICIVGDCGVGKTSLLTRFCDNSFQESYNNTIGVDFRVVTLKYQNLVLKLHIWDTAGQERFKSIALNYFKSSHGFMFVYDITVKKSFYNIPNWINLAFSNSNNIGINFLVGNKTDLDEREVEIAEGEKFAKEKKLFFFEASAKNNDNVEKIFKYFAFKLIEYFLKNKEEYIKNNDKTKISNNIEEINTNNKGKDGCFC